MSDIHLSPRQRNVIIFALHYMEANIDDIMDMLEEAPSVFIGDKVEYGEAEGIADDLKNSG